jgi:hypothetical protein
MENKMEREYLKPSEFYWGTGILLTINLLIIHHITQDLSYYILSILAFILTLFIGHNKKIINKFNYKQKGGKK